MAHLNGIQAGFFSNLAFAVGINDAMRMGAATSTIPNTAAIPETEAGWDSEFRTVAVVANGMVTTAGYLSVPNVREFPGIGTPANIVNVPVYGSATSRQIQGQADAPNLELTINYDPSGLAALGLLEGTPNSRINDGNLYGFQFSLLGQDSTSVEGEARFSSGTGGGLSSRPNSNFYFAGRFEAIAVNPQLTDANQATLTLSLQSQFYGPFTYDAS